MSLFPSPFSAPMQPPVHGPLHQSCDELVEQLGHHGHEHITTTPVAYTVVGPHAEIILNGVVRQLHSYADRHAVALQIDPQEVTPSLAIANIQFAGIATDILPVAKWIASHVAQQYGAA